MTVDVIQQIRHERRLCLSFLAVVQDGEGAFSRMRFPGQTQMKAIAAANDTLENVKPAAQWPEELCPGSMNCQVTDFPLDFDELAGEGDRIAKLDSGVFTPEFCIPKDEIENNRVGRFPVPGIPRMGVAQVWHCVVSPEKKGMFSKRPKPFHAWHVRRVDGTYPPFHGIVELMSDRKMRDAYGLQNGTRLKIDMFSAKVS